MANPAEKTSVAGKADTSASVQSLLASAIENIADEDGKFDTPVSALEEHLTQILTAETSSLADRLQVLDLSLLKEKFGDQWERIADIAHPAAERAISSHLGKADFHSRYQDA